MISHEAGSIRHVPRQTAATVRVAVVGDAQVGKTFLCRTLTATAHTASLSAYDMTTTPVATLHAVPLPSSSPPAQVILILVDFPGAASFNVRPPDSLLADSGAVALCFDVGVRESLTSAGKWLRRVHEARAAARVDGALPVALIGLNRTGATGESAIGAADAGAAAGALGARVFYVGDSAESVAAPFIWLAEHYAK